MRRAPVDSLKARVFLRCLVQARHERSEAIQRRLRFKEEIKRIKKMDVQGVFDSRIDALRDKAIALEREEALMEGVLHKEEVHEKDVQHMINELEEKLSTFIEDKKTRDKRITEIEEKIFAKLASQKQKAGKVAEQLERIEGIYKKLAKSGTYSKKKLEPLKEKISLLKKRFKKLSR